MRRVKVKPVSYLRPEEVQILAEEAGRMRYGERNKLLVRLLFQTGLRISEALSLTPSHFIQVDGVHALRVRGKGRKERLVHVPEPLYHDLCAFVTLHSIKPNQIIFKLHRSNAFRMIKKAALKAGLFKQVYPHLLRHSCAIERLRQTRNPRALQLHLGHSTMAMTMRYLVTLEQEDALREMAKVQFE